MRLLELFSGTKSIGRAFEKRGWEVVSLDLTNEFHPTIQADILEWDYKSCYPPGYFMVIWSSPCCTNYSRARTRGGPRDLVGADKLVQTTLKSSPTSMQLIIPSKTPGQAFFDDEMWSITSRHFTDSTIVNLERPTEKPQRYGVITST